MQHIFNTRAPATFKNSTARDFGASEPHTGDNDIDNAYEPPKTKTQGPLDNLLHAISAQCGSLGGFMIQLFSVPKRDEKGRSSTHSAAVSMLLGGRSEVDIIDIIKLIHTHKDSRPKAIRRSLTPASSKARPPEERMARWKMDQWAIERAEVLVEHESEKLSAKESGLHSPTDVSWDFVQDFSLPGIFDRAQQTAPVTLRFLAASAIARKKRPRPDVLSRAVLEPQLVAGKGSNRRNPWVIIMTTLLMLMNARNLQCNGFQKLIGVWLFSHSAPHGVFDVLGRMGMSIAYTTTFDLLKDLAVAARNVVCSLALDHRFLLIYDNINRMRRVWDPQLGDKDRMDSGTAATFVVLEGCAQEDLRRVFSVDTLDAERAKQGRRNLTVQVLKDRVDWAHLRAVMAVHIVGFLIQEVESLEHLRDELNNHLRTTLARRRREKGKKTAAYPLGTSSHDEGSTDGNKKVLDDLVLRQLKMRPEDIKTILKIVGGDQSTVEKIRTLRRFIADCPHGYTRYGWVLPLIQLWHMGWADLERILSTHWGKSDLSDISSFGFVNEHIARKVKNVKRPDFYPAQALVFDTLRAEVLDCWREHLKVANLSAHFGQQNNWSFQGLLNIATVIFDTYMSATSSMRAAKGLRAHEIFPIASPSSLPQGPSPSSRGDQVLANTILRMRDSMLHYEFQSAVADGDIGRALQVMGVWTFTFCGSGKTKYTNEMLELTCNFEFEFSEELRNAVSDNWLCNLTGFEGGCFPMDLMQEHLIKELKTRTGEHAAAFGETFFKEVISYNTRYFLEVKTTVRSAVGLGARSGAHRRKKKVEAIRLLSGTMREAQLHRYTKGRTFGHIAQDDFAAGDHTLSTSTRLTDFIERTLAEVDLDPEDGRQGDHTTDEQHNTDSAEEYEERDIPLPNIWIDGELVTDADDDDGFDAEDDNDDEI